MKKKTVRQKLANPLSSQDSRSPQESSRRQYEATKAKFDQKMAKNGPPKPRVIDYLDWKYSDPLPTRGMVGEMQKEEWKGPPKK